MARSTNKNVTLSITVVITRYVHARHGNYGGGGMLQLNLHFHGNPDLIIDRKRVTDKIPSPQPILTHRFDYEAFQWPAHFTDV